MKHLNVLIFVLFFLINCTTEVDYNSDLTNRGSLTYKIGSDEPFTGVATKKWPDGSIKVRWDFEIGKAVRHQEWYENGARVIDSGFRDGQYHGKVVMYYFKTDQKKSEGTYDSGVAVGKWRFWNEDGTVALDTVLFSK